MKKILLLSASLLAALSVNAATVVNVSGANGEQTLQQIVGSSFNVNSDQLASDSYFAAGDLSAQMIIEIAGYAGNNSFGIYEMGDKTNTYEVFAGSASAGATSAVIDLSSLGWTSFGFYLSNIVANFVWYSDADLNGAEKFDHFVTYKGVANPAPMTAGISLGLNDYLIGIEDLNLGDYDYNDMVVKVSLTPTTTQHNVPDNGATVALMGLGLAALAAVRRRQN